MKHLQKSHKVVKSVLLLIVLLGCISNKQNESNMLINGSWILQDRNAINYPQIIFNEDSTALFKSRGDTIYRFTYLLKGSNLTLQSITGEKETYEIVKLNKDSLVFNGLRENLEQQIYIRE